MHYRGTFGNVMRAVDTDVLIRLVTRDDARAGGGRGGLRGTFDRDLSKLAGVERSGSSAR